jgi:hypothetical protein
MVCLTVSLFVWNGVLRENLHCKHQEPRCCYCSYKVVQIWPGQFVCKQVTVRPGHIWTTLYYTISGCHKWLSATFLSMLSHLEKNTVLFKFIYSLKTTVFKPILVSNYYFVFLNVFNREGLQWWHFHNVTISKHFFTIIHYDKHKEESP